MSEKYNAIHPIDLYAGIRLRMGRELRGISQTKLSGLLPHPVTFQQIQKYERGVNRLSISRLWDLAIALELPLSYFLPQDRNETSLSSLLSTQEQSLIASFRRLSCKHKATLLLLINRPG